MTLSIVTGDHFRSLRREGDRLIGRACPAEYVVLPASDSLSRHLESAQIPFGRCDDKFVLLGENAIDFARALQLPLWPLLTGGNASPGDPLVRQIIASLMDVLLPDPSRAGEPCGIALPTSDEPPSRNFLAQLVRLRGYSPCPIRTSMAVVLAELGACAFTGLGLAFEADRCEVSVAHRGMEVAGCCVLLSAASEDEDVASYQSPDNSPPEISKEMLEGLVQEASDALICSETAISIPQPVTIACTGAITLQPEFSRQFADALRACRFPLDVRELRIPDDQRYTIARGCLIHAELEAMAEAESAVA